MSVGAVTRLSRLLAMVPWLLQRQGVPVSEAARHFGISESTLIKDLELLFVCGTPGHMPDDLIEADWESGKIYLGNADAIARPLRLALDEAIALLVGLHTLADVPGLHDREALERAIAKLSAATGEAADAARGVRVDLTAGASTSTLEAFRLALAQRRRLRMTYVVPSRDETTHRDVDPLRLLSVQGRWYLEGWCYRAEAIRRFRTDRVVDVTVLEVAASPPAQAWDRSSTDDLFTPSDEDVLVTLDLSPAAHWVADYYVVDSLEERPDGVWRVRLRAASPDWVPRLVLRTGGHARVVAPADLAENTVALARRALSAYAGL